MFEGVDNIDWESFGKTHIAVGMPTRKIPDCIHNMLNENQKNREYAIAGLLGEGQHLGMLSEATPSIIPFVLEALALPDYAERSYLIMGLALMFDDMFQSQVFNRLRLEIRVYDEIKKGYPVYKRLLSDSDRWTRLQAAQIMGYMQDDFADALSTLIARLPVEADTDTRTEIISAILKLSTTNNFFYSVEGKRATGELYKYLSINGSVNEKLQLAYAMNETPFRYSQTPEVKAFIREILESANTSKP